MAAEQSYEYSLPVEFINAGSETIWATADSTCIVEESDETNDILGPIVVPVKDPNLIFADGFESGNTSAWSSCQKDVDDLGVTRTAALTGSYGLRARLDDNNAIFCTDTHPAGTKTYRARFYFDPNTIRMANGNGFVLFQGNGGGKGILRVELRRDANRYQLRSGLLDDAGAWKYSGWYTVSDARHSVEFWWKASSRAGMNNGRLTLWVDGAKRADQSGVDNDTRQLAQVRLGAVMGVDTGTRGAFFVDDFVSRRDNYPISP